MKNLALNFPNYKDYCQIQFFAQPSELKTDDVFSAGFLINPTSLLAKVSLEINNFIYSGISDFDSSLLEKKHQKLKLYSSKGLSSKAIAQYCLTWGLIMLHQFDKAILNQKKKNWDQETFLCNPIRELQDLRIGVLGSGGVGTEVGSVFHKLGCKISCCSRTNSLPLEFVKFYQLTDLLSFFSDNDLVIICLPLRNETRNIIREEHLIALGTNSFLINVARGELISEIDLVKCLKEKRIGSATLDVFSQEPLSKRSSLWKSENLNITPHIAGNINSIPEIIENDFILKLKNELITDSDT